MKHCPACLQENTDDTAICTSCGYTFDSELNSAGTRIDESRSASGFAPGDLIAGRYRVERLLGQGGMGVVYLARDQALRDNPIALKMIHPSLIDHPEALQRFEEEVLTSQRLTHANIVRVHDLKRTDGLRFFTMEYLEGKSLRQWMADRKNGHPPFGVQEAAGVIGQVLAALAYAHQFTVHRDIKPENIMLQGEFPIVTVKLLDFGIARTLSTSRFTQTSQMLGTAYYMAPEQFQGAKTIDHRADLYAVGMVLYEMLTGEMAVGRFLLPGEMIDGLPRELDALVERSLAPRPDERYQSADEMRQALERIAGQAAGNASSAPLKQTVAKRLKPSPADADAAKGTGRKRAGWLLAFLLCILVAGGGWYLFAARTRGPVLTVVSTPPGAAVYVDNGHVGSSPAQVLHLPDGTHTVRITKDRYTDHEEQVFIQQATPRQLDVTLTPLPFGDLKVTSTPDGARILVDGEPRGTTPATLGRLPQGSRTITLKKEDYEDWQGQAAIVPLETAELDARLVSSFGSLDVTTDPTGAELYLDGKNIGVSPTSINRLIEGEHTLLARKPGYDDVRQTIAIQPETPSRAHLDMLRMYGRLSVASTPSGATVTIEGKPVGQTPLSLDSVRKGERTVRVELKGYDRWAKRR